MRQLPRSRIWGAHKLKLETVSVLKNLGRLERETLHNNGNNSSEFVTRPLDGGSQLC